MLNETVINLTAEALFNVPDALNKLIILHVCWEIPENMPKLEKMYELVQVVLNSVMEDDYEPMEDIFLTSSLPEVRQMYEDFCFIDYEDKLLMCHKMLDRIKSLYADT